MYTRLIVPLDGSDVAERVLNQAGQLSRLMNAPLHLLRVVSIGGNEDENFLATPTDIAAAEIDRQLELESAAHYLHTLRDLLDRRGYLASQELRQGNEVEEIVQSQRAGDLLVMSTHGRSGVQQWHMGGIAEGVLRKAHGPLMLLRTSDVSGSVPISRY